MSYCTVQQLIDLFGEDTVYTAADRDHDDVLDTDALNLRLDTATSEVNAYLRPHYSALLPLDPVPPVIVEATGTIALYKLSHTAGVVTEEERKRYEDTITFLSKLASGQAQLDIDVPEGEPGAGQIKGGTILDEDNPERLFTRKRTQGLL